MRDWKRAVSMTVAVLALAAVALVAPRDASAHGHGYGGGPRFVYGGGFYGYTPWFGFGPYWGWGWGGYPGAFYGPPGGVDMNAAMIAGFGAIELHVKPNRADVWVDGRYVAEARDLDGNPSYLWLPDGPHKLAVHKGGFQVFEEEIAVQRGMKKQVKIQLQPGDSPAPGPKPTDKATVEKKY
jgi:hypothetical protein